MKDGERLEEAEKAARGLAKMIDGATPDGWRFVLIMYDMRKSKLATYISNCQRAGIIKALREMAFYLEKGMPPGEPN